MRITLSRINLGWLTMIRGRACQCSAPVLAFVLLSTTLVRQGAHASTATDDAKPLPILLVHGIYDDGTALRPLQHALEAAGYRCFAPALRPADGRLGIVDLARKLRTATDQHYGPHQPVFVVAFSLGGLVVRSYLETLGGAARCRGLITISTPHAGTLTAYLTGGQGARDLRPFSPFLRALRRDEPRLDALPLTSVWNPLDLMIFPSFSSAWPRAESRVIFCSSHPVMIRSRLTLRTVLRTLARENPPVESGSGLRPAAGRVRPPTPR